MKPAWRLLKWCLTPFSWHVLVVGLLAAGAPAATALDVNDARVIYGTNAGDDTLEFREQTFIPNQLWGAASPTLDSGDLTVRDLTTVNVTDGEIGWVIHRTSHRTGLEVLAVQYKSGAATGAPIQNYLALYTRLPGVSTWTRADGFPRIIVNEGAYSKRLFDLAVEARSGDIVLVQRWYQTTVTASDKKLYSCTIAALDGTVDCPLTPIGTLGGTVLWVRLAAHPTSDEIVLAAADSGAVTAWQWNGTAWTPTSGLTGVLPPFDIAYEGVAGRAVLLYKPGAGKLSYRTKGPGVVSWSAPTGWISSGINPNLVGLFPQPGTNRIGISVWVPGATVFASMWNPANVASCAGATCLELDTKATIDPEVLGGGDTNGQAPAQIGWAGNEAVLVYWDQTTVGNRSSGLDWARWTPPPGGGWTLQSDTGANAGNAGNLPEDGFQFVQYPGSPTEALLIISGKNAELWAAIYRERSGWRTPIPPPTPTTNLLSNPGFEINPCGEYFVAFAIPATCGTAPFLWVTDSAFTRSGSGAVKIEEPTPPSPLDGSPPMSRWLSGNTAVPVTPGTTYEASMWLKTVGVTDPKGATLAINFWESSGVVVPGSTRESAQVTGTTGWTKMHVAAVAPATASFMRVEARLYSDSNPGTPAGTLWADDVVIQQSDRAALTTNLSGTGAPGSASDGQPFSVIVNRFVKPTIEVGSANTQVVIPAGATNVNAPAITIKDPGGLVLSEDPNDGDAITNADLIIESPTPWFSVACLAASGALSKVDQTGCNPATEVKATYAVGNFQLVLNVMSDFAIGDQLVITGAKFQPTAGPASTLMLKSNVRPDATAGQDWDLTSLSGHTMQLVESLTLANVPVGNAFTQTGTLPGKDLLKFTAAAKGGGVKVTRLKFGKLFSGGMAWSNVSQLELWDGASPIATHACGAGCADADLDFSGLASSIGSDTTKTYALKANLNLNAGNVMSVSLAPSASGPTGDVEADGVTSGFLKLHSLPGALPVPGLAISKTHTTPETLTLANVAVPNAFPQTGTLTGKDLLQFTATAAGGTVTVQRLNFAVTFASGMAWSNVSKLELWDGAAVLATKTTPLDADFTGLASAVTTAAAKTYTLKADVTLSAGHVMTVSLAPSPIAGPWDIQATGTVTGLTNLHTIANAIPTPSPAITRTHTTPETLTLANVAVPNAFPQTGTLTGKDLLKFTATAAGGTVKINQLHFTTDLPNASGMDWANVTTLELWDGGTAAIATKVSPVNADFTGLANFIASGTSKTYTLKADVTLSAGHQLTLSLPVSGVEASGMTSGPLDLQTITNAITIPGAPITKLHVAKSYVVTAPTSTTSVKPKDSLSVTWEPKGGATNIVNLILLPRAVTNPSQTVAILSGLDVSDVSTQPGPTYTYTWPSPPGVPENALSNEAVVRVQDVADLGATGDSAPFTIEGEFTLIDPAAGAKWLVGQSQTIHWKMLGQMDSVKVELCSGAGCVPLPGSPVDTSGAPLDPVTQLRSASLSWTPAVGDAGSGKTIRLTDMSASHVAAQGSGPATPGFSVVKLNLVAPVGGEVWEIANPAQPSQQILWDAAGIATLRLDYSTDGSTWVTNAATFPATSACGATPQCFAWAVPAAAKSKTAKIRLVDVDATSIAAVSPASFRIVSRLHVTAPLGDVPVNPPTPHTVSWQVDVPPFTQVTVEASMNGLPYAALPGSPVTFDGSTAGSTGSLGWTPTEPSDPTSIRICDVDDPQTCSPPAAPFKVTGLTISTPAGGAVYTVGTNPYVPIAWTSVGAGNPLILAYSTDGTSFTTISSSIANANGPNTYDGWLLANTFAVLSGSVYVKLTDPINTTTTAGPFTIKGAFSFLSPAGGTYSIGDTVPISWDTFGQITAVSLGWSTNDCVSSTAITPVPPKVPGETTSVNWTVLAAAVSNSLRFCLADAMTGHPVTTAMSAPIVVGAKLAFQGLVDGDHWAVNTSHPITWTTLGSVGQVLIEYGTESGGVFTPLGVVNGGPQADSGTGTTTITWNVSDIPAVVGDPQVNWTVPFKLRIKDVTAGHPEVPQVSAETLNAHYYHIEWIIKNENGTTIPSGVSVVDSSGWTVLDDSWVAATDPFDGQLRRFRFYKYYTNVDGSPGTYTTQVSKANYQPGEDKGPDGLGWSADRHQTRTITIISDVGATIPIRVNTAHQYDAVTKQVAIRAWLEQRGQLESNPAILGPGPSTIEIYSGSTLLATLSDASPDPAGQYEFTWDAGAVAPGIYFARAKIERAGNPVTSGGAFNIDLSSGGGGPGGVTLGELQTELQPIKDATVGPSSTLATQITGVQTAIAGDIATAKGELSAEVAGVQATADDIKADTGAMRPLVEEMAPKVTAILEDPDAGLPSIKQEIKDQTKTLRRGGILNRDMELEQGERALIQYRSGGGVPSLSIYDGSGAPMSVPPLLLNSTTGLYESTFDTASRSLGEYRVVVDEPASADSAGTLDSIVISVREPVATAKGVGAVTTKLNDLGAQLTAVEKTLDSKLTAIQAAMATSAEVQTILGTVEELEGSGTAGDTESLAALERAIGGLKSQLAATEQQTVGPAPEATQTILSRLAELQRAVESAEGGGAAIAPAQNAAVAAREALQVLQQLQTQVGAGAGDPALLEQFKDRMTAVSSFVRIFANEVNADELAAKLQALARQASGLGSEKGYQFDTLFEISQSQATDVKTVRNQVEELKAILEVQRMILERNVNQPVMKTWFEGGS